jgi:hypothetical protein
MGQEGMMRLPHVSLARCTNGDTVYDSMRRLHEGGDRRIRTKPVVVYYPSSTLSKTLLPHLRDPTRIVRNI